MCNLYSLITPQAEIRASFGVSTDRADNLPPLPGIFPDQRAPVVRVTEDGERVLEMFRWGIPGPKQFGGACRKDFWRRKFILARRAHSGHRDRFRARQTDSGTVPKWVGGGCDVLSGDDFFGRRRFATRPEIH